MDDIYKDILEKHFDYSVTYNRFIAEVDRMVNDTADTGIFILSNTNYSFVEYSLLGMLFINGTISMSELAGLMRVSAAHLSMMVSALEKKGLVYRFQKTNNRRTNYVSLTEEGLKGRKNLLKKRAAIQMEMFNKTLSDSELEKLSCAYDVLNGVFEKIQNRLGGL